MKTLGLCAFAAACLYMKLTLHWQQEQVVALHDIANQIAHAGQRDLFFEGSGHWDKPTHVYECDNNTPFNHIVYPPIPHDKPFVVACAEGHPMTKTRVRLPKVIRTGPSLAQRVYRWQTTTGQSDHMAHHDGVLTPDETYLLIRDLLLALEDGRTPDEPS